MKAAVYNRKTLAGLLITAAEDYPCRGVGFIRPDGSVNFLKYPELLQQALAISGALRKRGLSSGDQAMIIMTRNEEIVPTVWACILERIIPTILQPPLSFTEFNQPAEKIVNVFRILNNPHIILSEDLSDIFRSDVFPIENLSYFDELKDFPPDHTLTTADGSDLAFIQFSSGSTGNPKGIMLTHENILANLAAISVGLDIHDHDVMTNWMPLYHDMGFFGFHMTPVFAGSNHYLINPVDFIKKPVTWLEVMTEVRCSITGCPNFGQALLLRYLKNRDEKRWDLTNLKAIVNGAEPISTRIMTEFTEKLFSSNLRREAMMPAYGMAENTLAMSFSPLQEEPVVTPFNRELLQKQGVAVREAGRQSDILELVSVGKALDDVDISILDDEGNVLEEGREGHIRIRGKSVTKGYYNDPAATAEAFDGNWLKTGDRGFFFEDHLYITGRIKDIIFVHGQNLYAHDLENLASKHSDIPYGKVIIGGVFDQKKGKDLILLFLVGSPNRALCNQFLELKTFFRDTYGIGIDEFVPVKSNQVPKTSSGKIQRYKLISDYRNGMFDEAVTEVKRLIREFRTVGL